MATAQLQQRPRHKAAQRASMSSALAGACLLRLLRQRRQRPLSLSWWVPPASAVYALLSLALRHGVPSLRQRCAGAMRSETACGPRRLPRRRRDGCVLSACRWLC